MYICPPKYHHYWPLMAQMPPLTNNWSDPDNPSQVYEWIKFTFDVKAPTAKAVFDSARGAKFIVYEDGIWRGDARAGFDFWKNLGRMPQKNRSKRDLRQRKNPSTII